MSNDNLTRIVDDFIDAFNRGDWEGFKAPLATNVHYEESGTGRVVDGADAYVTLVQGWKGGLPDGRGETRQMVLQDGTVVQEITWLGTHTAPLLTPGRELPPSNRSSSVPATLWYTFRDGRIAEIHHHLDLMTMLQQLGAIPA